MTNMTMRIDDAVLRPSNNNFNLVRFVLASAVIFSHSFDITGRGIDPTIAWFGVPISNLAVDGFFALSGFLVTASLLRLRSARRFLFARWRRLLPGLFLMLALVVFVMGPLVTRVPVSDYFRSHETWSYFFANGSLLLTHHQLPGVFTGLPLDGAVNGSLWTLRYEFFCYLALMLLWLAGIFATRMRFLAFFLAFLLAAALSYPVLGDPRALVGGFAGDLLFYGRRLMLAFLVGSLAYLFRERIPMSWPLLVVFTVICLVAEQLWSSTLLRPFLLTYACLCVGFLTARKRARFADIHDYSYGMYIYAYPVQQLVYMALGPINPYLHMALSLAATLPFAALSWHLVEKPVLQAGKARPNQVGALST